MSYPESADIFTNKTGSDDIASSDPNVAYDAIETVEGLVGALGKPQTWSTTLLTLLRKYRHGNEIDITGGTLTVRAGEAVLENTDGTKFAFRRNVADVPVTVSNIDVGSMAATTYYVYMTAGTVATTGVVQFSTDPNAPSGIGTAPYRYIGWFDNAAAAALTCTYAGSSEAGNIVNIVHTQNGLYSTATNPDFPVDDTKPQISEGAEIVSMVYKMKKATNRLIVMSDINWGAATSEHTYIALFTNLSTDAFAMAWGANTSGNIPAQIHICGGISPGTTAAITISMRLGFDDAGTCWINASKAASQVGDGTAATHITVFEVES